MKIKDIPLPELNGTAKWFHIEQQVKFGFICKVCGSTQMLDDVHHVYFPVCDQCLTDLSEIIKNKRSNQL